MLYSMDYCEYRFNYFYVIQGLIYSEGQFKKKCFLLKRVLNEGQKK